MKIGVIEFPGSDCAELKQTLVQLFKHEVVSIWHDEEDQLAVEAVILPGGSSFADYLRPGALARGSRVMGPLRRFAIHGGPVLGIGNGFQILCELDLLPGALLVNPDQRFFSQNIYVSVESKDSPFTRNLASGYVLKLPLACYYGRYWADSRVYQELEEGDCVVLRYCDQHGDTGAENNVLDSLSNIAGITNRKRNVLGVMPRIDRALDESFGSTEARAFFDQIGSGES